MVSELNFPSCPAAATRSIFTCLNCELNQSVVAAAKLLQISHFSTCFSTLCSGKFGRATLLPPSNLFPSVFLLPFPVYLYCFFCFWFAGNYINCNSLFSGFCFLLSSPSLFAMLLLSALCLVKLLVSLLWEARGKSRVGGGSVAVQLLLVLQSGRVMQMQESCN